MQLPLRFDMTITRADFRRLLPAAVNQVHFIEEKDAFVHSERGRGWRIGIEPLPQLRLGLIRLERHRLSVEFAGYADEEIRNFMARFEMYFRRGGG
ncbi:MAG: hypothetical protein WC830_00630 [Burkholderiales bacterium]|jgi:hypothetical protein